MLEFSAGRTVGGQRWLHPPPPGVTPPPQPLSCSNTGPVRPAGKMEGDFQQRRNIFFSTYSLMSVCLNGCVLALSHPVQLELLHNVMPPLLLILRGYVTATTARRSQWSARPSVWVSRGFPGTRWREAGSADVQHRREGVKTDLRWKQCGGQGSVWKRTIRFGIKVPDLTQRSLSMIGKHSDVRASKCAPLRARAAIFSRMLPYRIEFNGLMGYDVSSPFHLIIITIIMIILSN